MRHTDKRGGGIRVRDRPTGWHCRRRLRKKMEQVNDTQAGVLWGWSVLLISSDKWQAAEQAGCTSVTNPDTHTHTHSLQLCPNASSSFAALFIFFFSLCLTDRSLSFCLISARRSVFRMNALMLQWLARKHCATNFSKWKGWGFQWTTNRMNNQSQNHSMGPDGESAFVPADK